jgi:hypothetical protein
MGSSVDKDDEFKRDSSKPDREDHTKLLDN